MNRTGMLTALLLCSFAATPGLAGLDVDLGASVELSNRSDLYVAISARYYDEDRATVERVARRFDDSDDLAVALFISKHSGRSTREVISLRRLGLPWWEISRRFAVPSDVWFVEVQHDPGPPYGKAYGHWKKHQRTANVTFELSDIDARNLVAVRMLHEYFDVSAEVAMSWRASGRELPVLVADEYGKRHGKGHDQTGGSKQDKSGKGKRPAKRNR